MAAALSPGPDSVLDLSLGWINLGHTTTEKDTPAAGVSFFNVLSLAPPPVGTPGCPFMLVAYSLLIRNCGQLLTLAGGPAGRPLAGADLANWLVLENAFVACENSRIVALGPMHELNESLVTAATRVLDAQGQVVMPGLVECHTHLVFAGNRAPEFQRKLQGESYLDILASGGGILSTVRATRAAAEAELLANARHHLQGFRRYGVTTVEAKSGYGLDKDTELRLVRVARQAGQQEAMRVVPTFLGAHVVAPEYQGRPAAYLDFLVEQVLPALQGEAEFVDIFCEQGAFSVPDARRYLQRAQELGFGLKIHAEQLHDLGGCAMAAELGAASVDHCDYLNPADAARVAATGQTVAVLLPLVPLFLRQEQYAPGRELIAQGVPVAVSTDFNPGSCPSKNLWLALSMACLKMGFTPKEAIAAGTLNAAWALNLAAEIGSLEVGKQADILVLNVPDYQEIPYWLGENPVRHVVVAGQVQVV
ncbi:imidazolonepropionase [Hymenobacter elongatus]|uniref:Imidazolonepropionase n=1 Tax=Hymenobacter elongatus TaxID=877208 RepID=A0A4Z0PQM3_9BACT|nr:imidazolonepropionase [Hymenobacter elongatus]TGE18352.1 imidazolonepropionase [Hymenobacter elongatus]